MITIGLKKNRVLDYLDEILPSAFCELNYDKDYELLIAVMLSAQTTDKRVNEVTKVLFNKYKSIDSLNRADINDLIEIIRPIGTYMKKAQNIKDIASKLLDIGYVPNDRTFLESLSGVGRKTANVVLSVLYDVPCIAVDTHVERVSKRIGLVDSKADVLEVEGKLTKIMPEERLNKLHHQLVLFGRYYCKAKNPNCYDCKLKDICKYYQKKKKSS